ncbi:MAG: hypothetical protein NVS1B14_04170 [Vulcanimicrobiaceae bacterium]
MAYMNLNYAFDRGSHAAMCCFGPWHDGDSLNPNPPGMARWAWSLGFRCTRFVLLEQELHDRQKANNRPAVFGARR